MYHVDMKIKYRFKHNVYYAFTYHVVWSPKYRRKMLVEAVAEWLTTIIREACQEHQAEVPNVEVMPDHVHLLVGCDLQFGIHRLVKLIKGRSSRLLRQAFPPLTTGMPTLWTNSYFVRTVGGAPINGISQYIESQKHV